jgi:SAM-dependent methyltransferase
MSAPGLPHETWAELYDAVYERGYGRLYEWLTRTTIEQLTVNLTVPNRVRLVDFGAGTGRLAIPLAEAGYQVTAIEPVRGMLDLLEAKARTRGLSIETFHGRIEDFQAAEPYDLAACVFTVLLYILDEDALQRSYQAVADCLKPGGLFLVDVPRREMFTGGVVRGEGVKREMEITARGGDFYDYREQTAVEIDGRTVRFEEAFPIRYWARDDVLARLEQVGMVVEKDLSGLMKRSGCDYFLIKKED